MNDAKRIRVLIVDDSKTILATLQKTLRTAGYEVISASDGQEGLETLLGAEEKPDVIITDINMPRMDGFKFIEAVRASNGALSRIPMICLTTEVSEAKKNQARKAGATGWMTKPFNPDKLVWTIRRVTA